MRTGKNERSKNPCMMALDGLNTINRVGCLLSWIPVDPSLSCNHCTAYCLIIKHFPSGAFIFLTVHATSCLRIYVELVVRVPILTPFMVLLAFFPHDCLKRVFHLS